MKRRELFEIFWKLSTMKGSIALQNSMIKWLQQGDPNSSFFHACVNKRRRENTLYGLSVQGSWLEDPKLVKEGIFNHYQSLFNQNGGGRPTLNGISFNKISTAQLAMLTTEFSLEEIKAVLWDCDGNKSLGTTSTISTY